MLAGQRGEGIGGEREGGEGWLEERVVDRRREGRGKGKGKRRREGGRIGGERKGREKEGG